MKALLLADANQLSASLSEYEANRHRIESAAYKTFTLREADFYDLIFMEANDSVWANNQMTKTSSSTHSEDVVQHSSLPRNGALPMSWNLERTTDAVETAASTALSDSLQEGSEAGRRLAKRLHRLKETTHSATFATSAPPCRTQKPM